MKIQYQDKILEVTKPVTSSQLLEKEIQTSQQTIVVAKFNNEYKNL